MAKARYVERYNPDNSGSEEHHNNVEALIKACKVGLLDHHNRAYMRVQDPMWYKQMVDAVKLWEPDIEMQIGIADKNDANWHD